MGHSGHRSQRASRCIPGRAMSQQVHIALDERHKALLTMTIPQAVEWAGSKWGDKLAFSFVDAPDTLTYAELAESIARLRTGLTVLGLRAGERVGIMIPNQVEFPLAWLAIIDAGAVAV